MFKLLLKPVEQVQNLGRKAQISASLKVDDCLVEASNYNRLQRILMMISAGVTFGGVSLLLATSAHADGIADFFTSGATQADTIKTGIGKIVATGGFGAACYGGYNMYRKNKEGDRSQIEGKQVYGPILGGAVLGSIGAVMIKFGETIGLSSGDYGTVPGAGS